MIRATTALLLLAGLCKLSSAATIIIVRHADRDAGMAADVPLNARGEERARQLAAMLKDSGIRAIYVTEVHRTQQTAEPTAREFHLQPVVIPQNEMDTLVSRLEALPADETVLVVGHANTVPLLVQKLGGLLTPMSDSEYDRMVIVTTGKGDPSVLTLRYGEATH